MATIVNNTFEVDTEHHVNWFDTTCVRSTADFHSGTASLLTTVTAQFAGVILDNGPSSFTGFTAGNSYDFSIWAKEAAATMPTLDWELTWVDGGGGTVGTDNISIPRSAAWAQTTATKVAPAGAVALNWAFEDHGNGNTGAAWYLDDILVTDTVTAAPQVGLPLMRPPGRISPVGRWSPFIGDPTPAATSAAATAATGTGQAFDATVTAAVIDTTAFPFMRPPGRLSPAGRFSLFVGDPTSAAATNAAAGNAAGTGTAFDATLTVAPVAGNAAGTGAAGAAVPSGAPVAGNAAGTGAAGAAVPSVAVNAGNAAGTGAAADATVTTVSGQRPAQPLIYTSRRHAAWDPPAAQILIAAPIDVDASASAGNAAGTGTAYQPTVNTGSGTSASAGNAAGTGTAYGPTLNSAPSAGNAAGSGAAAAAVPNVGTRPSAATGTGSANAGTLSISVSAGNAAGTGTAGAATSNVGASAGNAAGTGSASGPAASVATGAGNAAGTGDAGNALAGQSFDPPPLFAPPPGRLSPRGRWSPFVGNVQASTDANPAAAPASGAGTAFDPAVSVKPSAGSATGTGAAGSAAATVPVAAGNATGTGAAGAPTSNVDLGGGNAAGTGTAHSATISTSTSASAGHASGTGSAGSSIIRIEVIPAAATGTGAGHNTTNGVPVVTYPIRADAVTDYADRLSATAVTDDAVRYHAGTPT